MSPKIVKESCQHLVVKKSFSLYYYISKYNFHFINLFCRIDLNLKLIFKSIFPKIAVFAS